MTISGIVICSTCQQKIKLRHQVGTIYPVKVNIPCDKCGKILKGEVVRDKECAFQFPYENVTMEFDNADQVVSVSTELPILKEKTNQVTSTLTPFLALFPGYFTMQELGNFTAKINEFDSFYKSKFNSLITLFELFENKNWFYFLNHLKENFDNEIDEIETFEHCSLMLVSLNENVFDLLRTKFYKKEFDDKIFNELYKNNHNKKEKLKELKIEIEKYINVEDEFIKGINLLGQFLENSKSFLPVVLLSSKNDFSKSYGEDLNITTFDFNELKHIFIEQFEFLSRISSIYFGLLNLEKENDFDNFGTITECHNLSFYCNRDNGIKKEIIKKEPILNDYFLNTLNSQIRNGIGHLKTNFNAKNQIIQYFPYKSPAKKDRFKEIYLIDFAFIIFQQSLKIHNSLRIIAKLNELIK